MNGLLARNDGNDKVRKKRVDHRRPEEKEEYVPKPTLYSSVVETERKLRQISLGCLDPKPAGTTNKVCM